MASLRPEEQLCAACKQSLLVAVDVDDSEEEEEEEEMEEMELDSEGGKGVGVGAGAGAGKGKGKGKGPAPAAASADDDEDKVPDDVELICGHHFHWSCFAEHYHASADETKHLCPSCHASVISLPPPSSSAADDDDNDAAPALLVTLRNEGGVQHGIDLGALLEEEAFYDAHPELKLVRAWLEFCAEGDTASAQALLAAQPELVDARDFETGQSGLHVAVLNRREEMVRFLLRQGADGEVHDAAGRTWVQFAREMGAGEAELRTLGVV